LTSVARRPSQCRTHCDGKYDTAGRVGSGAVCIGPGYLPRGTEHRIHKRVLALRAEARKSLEGGQLAKWF
jgi:hypothetical protein